ncbi:MAG TPA: hypothetical protein VF503_00110 [Sphingobium sp.]|uniref:hypothetical protein n=1 Tax=Sphingobium sp. TaxID=1912891 RepID=UPI002ED37AF1
MPSILALDLSTKSTGWALWTGESERPVSGTWALANAMTDHGMVFMKLHQRMNDLYTVSPFEFVLYEEPLNLGPGSGVTNKDTIHSLIGLAAHVDSFCAAKRVRKCRSINQSSWRRHFLGPMKRGTKSKTLKEYALERCAQLGLSPSKHDEAEALGILSYACAMENIVPPWERDEVLRQPLGTAMIRAPHNSPEAS